MEDLEVKDQMLIFIRGTDKGNAVFKSLVLIILLSSILISFLWRINALEQYSAKYKAFILNEIQKSNMEILNRYELY